MEFPKKTCRNLQERWSIGKYFGTLSRMLYMIPLGWLR